VEVKPLAPSKKRSHFSPYTSSWKLDLSPSTSASLVAKPLYSSVNSPLSEKQTASTESQRCRGASPPPKDRDSDPEGAALGGGVWPHPRSNLDPERDPGRGRRLPSSALGRATCHEFPNVRNHLSEFVGLPRLWMERHHNWRFEERALLWTPDPQETDTFPGVE
jgi:hypothetical protein